MQPNVCHMACLLLAGITPLMAAVKAGKPEAVAELLAAGADPRRGDSSGATALHHAAWQGQGACLEVLLQHGQQQEEAAGSSSWAHR
jgi:ankyrin repeat protein